MNMKQKRTNLPPYWIYFFVLCCLSWLCNFCERMSPTAWNTQSIFKALSDLQRYNTFPFRIEIKSYRTLVLLVVYNSTVTRPMWTTARAKNYDTEKFATTSHTPSPFRIKAAWILTWVRRFFGTRVHHLLNLLTFLIKLLFLVPEHCSLMYWPVEWWAVQLELANKHGLSLVVESVGTVFLSIIILLKKGSTFNLNVLVHI